MYRITPPLLLVALLLSTVAAAEEGVATPEETQRDPTTAPLSLSELMATSRPLAVKRPDPIPTTPPSIQRQMRRRVGQLKRCYENMLKSHASLSGRVVIAWRVNARGRVEDARVVESTLGAPEMEACLVRTIQRWRFTVEEPASVEQAFVFVDK